MSGAEAAMVFFVLGGGFYVLRPIAAAVAKRIAGDVPARTDTDENHEAVLAELRDLREELSALAERVDFTERMRLGPPR